MLFHMLTGITVVQTILAGIEHHGVFCTQMTINRGTKFGPYKGRILKTSEIKACRDNSYMWEVNKLK